MNRRLARNLRLKLGVTAVAALATLGFFGLLRAETPTRAGATATVSAASSTVPSVSTPAMNVPPAAPVGPANRPPSTPAQPQSPPTPAPRLRPITRTRAS